MVNLAISKTEISNGQLDALRLSNIINNSWIKRLGKSQEIFIFCFVSLIFSFIYVIFEKKRRLILSAGLLAPLINYLALSLGLYIPIATFFFTSIVCCLLPYQLIAHSCKEIISAIFSGNVSIRREAVKVTAYSFIVFGISILYLTFILCIGA